MKQTLPPLPSDPCPLLKPGPSRLSQEVYTSWLGSGPWPRDILSSTRHKERCRMIKAVDGGKRAKSSVSCPLTLTFQLIFKFQKTPIYHADKQFLPHNKSFPLVARLYLECCCENDPWLMKPLSEFRSVLRSTGGRVLTLRLILLSCSAFSPLIFLTEWDCVCYISDEKKNGIYMHLIKS